MSIEWDLVGQPPAPPTAGVGPGFAGEGGAGVASEFLAAVGFDGSAGQVLPVPGAERTEVLAGLGPRSAVDDCVVRWAMAGEGGAISVRSLAVVVPAEGPVPDAVRAVVEGLLL